MKTQNLHRYILPVVLSAALFSQSACTKQLDLNPIDNIDASKAYRNIPDINMGVIGAYEQLNFTTVRAVSLASDECTLPNENTVGRYVATYRWQYDPTSSTITTLWGDLYRVIDRVNRTLAAINNVPVKAHEQELKLQYEGELHALRAYCHFELLRYFGEAYAAGKMGVPYMFESKISSPARDKFEQVIAYAKEDLQKAADLIPADFSDKSRITLPTISAMRARIALYEKNWADAITYAKEAIGKEPLASKTDFKKIFTSYKERVNSEVFWRIAQTANSPDFIGNIYSEIQGYKLYTPSYELLNKFDKTNDVRFSTYIRPSGNSGTGAAPYLVSKYEGDLTDASSIYNLSDIITFRTGEMYLILAEAYAENNQLDLANTTLNNLRAARINGYTAINYNNKPDFITALLNERFKELAFEGHRFFDLRRHNLDITREPADVVNALGAVTMKPTDATYAFPIPIEEFRGNKNEGMKQNPHY